MDTDDAWELWGQRDAYFGVLTDSRYRASALTEEALAQFFALGEFHVAHILATCRQRLNSDFAPDRVLDFGCGVGRLLIPFAAAASEVVGVDVARSMLDEARRNCAIRGISNVLFASSDDELSTVDGDFDLVHSCIVLQHIEVTRGRKLFRELVHRVRSGGCGALHVTYAWDIYRETFGSRPPPPPIDDSAVARLRRTASRWKQTCFPASPSTPAPDATSMGDPEMQMHFYNLSELMFVLQQARVQDTYVEFTDHGGALGAFLFFRRS